MLFVLNVAAWTCIGFAVMQLLDSGAQGHWWYQRPAFVLTLLVLGALLSALASVLAARGVRNAQLAALEPFPLEQDLSVLEQGLSFESRWGTSIYLWSALQGLQQLPEHTALVVRPYLVLVVPHRAFGSATEREAFATLIRARAGL